MKKGITFRHIIFFAFLALIGGFIGGIVRPFTTEIIYIEDVGLIEATNAVSPAVVMVVGSNSPANTGLKNAASGFIVSKKGLVVTNRHVVDDPEADYSVLLTDGRSFSVSRIESSEVNDLAVLTFIDLDGGIPDNLPVVTRGDSDTIRVGQRVIAIGSTGSGLENTISSGVISGRGHNIAASGLQDVQGLTNLIQTDAAIQAGGSGGALVNLMGEVIGINTALETTTGLISFAIPINELEDLLE